MFIDRIGKEEQEQTAELNECIAEHYNIIMTLLGIEFFEDNEHTPLRVAKMLTEMTETLRKDVSELDEEMSFFQATGSRGMIEVKDIPFTSICSHHHLPFYGYAKVSYIPSYDKIIGLSKIPRVIKWFASQPQLQERLTEQIGSYLVEKLEPECLSVSLYDVTHTCMLCRGVRSPGKTDTHFEYSMI